MESCETLVFYFARPAFQVSVASLRGLEWLLLRGLAPGFAGRWSVLLSLSPSLLSSLNFTCLILMMVVRCVIDDDLFQLSKAPKQNIFSAVSK
ncbi:hypothetical protein ACET3Z_010714 [Daucus carota]